MKPFRLWAVLAPIFVAAGFAACDDDTAVPDDDRYLDAVEIVADWQVVSWTEHGVPDSLG